MLYIKKKSETTLIHSFKSTVSIVLPSSGSPLIPQKPLKGFELNYFTYTRKTFDNLNSYNNPVYYQHTLAFIKYLRSFDCPHKINPTMSKHKYDMDIHCIWVLVYTYVVSFITFQTISSHISVFHKTFNRFVINSILLPHQIQYNTMCVVWYKWIIVI